jgi:hypothetical protein
MAETMPHEGTHSHDHDHPHDHEHINGDRPWQPPDAATQAQVATERLAIRQAEGVIQAAMRMDNDKQAEFFVQQLATAYVAAAQAEANVVMLQSQIQYIAGIKMPMFPEQEIKEILIGLSGGGPKAVDALAEIKQAMGIPEDEPVPEPAPPAPVKPARTRAAKK